MNKIDRAIRHLQGIGRCKKTTFCSICDCVKTSLEILSHVKEHGLALSEGEIENAITKAMDEAYRKKDAINIKKDIAKEIAKRQKGK